MNKLSLQVFNSNLGLANKKITNMHAAIIIAFNFLNFFFFSQLAVELTLVIKHVVVDRPGQTFQHSHKPRQHVAMVTQSKQTQAKCRIRLPQIKTVEFQR